jgi:hypothetical protein
MGLRTILDGRWVARTLSHTHAQSFSHSAIKRKKEQKKEQKKGGTAYNPRWLLGWTAMGHEQVRPQTALNPVTRTFGQSYLAIESTKTSGKCVFAQSEKKK